MITKIKKKKKLSGLLFGIFLIILVLLSTTAFIVSNWKIQKKRSELKVQTEQLEKEIKEAERRNQELRAGISQSLTETSLEREARERFNLKKPEEQVVTVLPAEEEEKKIEENKSFWQKIWDPIKYFISNGVKTIKLW